MHASDVVSLCVYSLLWTGRTRLLSSHRVLRPCDLALDSYIACLGLCFQTLSAKYTCIIIFDTGKECRSTHTEETVRALNSTIYIHVYNYYLSAIGRNAVRQIEAVTHKNVPVSQVKINYIIVL